MTQRITPVNELRFLV